MNDNPHTPLKIATPEKSNNINNFNLTTHDSQMIDKIKATQLDRQQLQTMNARLDAVEKRCDELLAILNNLIDLK